MKEFSGVYDLWNDDDRQTYIGDKADLQKMGKKTYEFRFAPPGWKLPTAPEYPVIVLSTRQIDRNQAESILGKYRSDGRFATEMDLGDVGNIEYVNKVIDELIGPQSKGRKEVA